MSLLLKFSAPIIFLLLVYACKKNSIRLTNCDDLQNDVRNANDSFYLVIPNAFTPNGDGLNDWYGPDLKNISAISFTVTDNQNKILFTTNNLGEKWKPANSSVKQDKYYYRIQGTSTNNKKIGICGEVNLLYCFPKLVNKNTFYFQSQFQVNGTTAYYNTSIPSYEVIPDCH